MALTSVLFLIFFGASLAVYYLIPGRLQWGALLLFSLCFFLFSAKPHTIVYLLASIISTSFCATRIAENKEAQNESKARSALVLGIVINLGMLAVLKYSPFFVRNFNSVFSLIHLPLALPPFKHSSPLGISFYTMTILGYLLDCYWGITTPQKNLLKTALFVSYFPQLTSGPITRHEQMREQLYAPHKFDCRRATFGLQRILWGFFKKLLISVRLGSVVDKIYGAPATYSGLYIWLAAALFTLQLYTDFSGCMDIVIGASECYGIILPENFRAPFFSRSVQEFWQRWHITLGAWMKDYILYPVLRSGLWKDLTGRIKNRWGRKAAKQAPGILGMLCVWLLMGLWHGGSWKFVVGWALWFWACITLAQILELVFKKTISFFNINTDCFSWRLFQSARVFILVCIGNMFFRLNGFKATLHTMKLGLRWNPAAFLNGSLDKLGFGGGSAFIILLGLGGGC